jgi:hypothetical protein
MLTPWTSWKIPLFFECRNYQFGYIQLETYEDKKKISKPGINWPHLVRKKYRESDILRNNGDKVLKWPSFGRTQMVPNQGKRLILKTNHKVDTLSKEEMTSICTSQEIMETRLRSGQVLVSQWYQTRKNNLFSKLSIFGRIK